MYMYIRVYMCFISWISIVDSFSIGVDGRPWLLLFFTVIKSFFGETVRCSISFNATETYC